MTLQTLYKIEKITFEYGNYPMPMVKNRELIGVLRTPFEAETFLFDVSGELIQYRALKYFIRYVAEQYGVDNEVVMRRERPNLYYEAVRRYRDNNSTMKKFLDKYGLVYEIYRIDTMHFHWGSQ